MHIRHLLEENAKLIDKLIEKYIPKKTDKSWFKFFHPSYEFDYDALNRALSTPIWDFLERGGKRWRATFFLLLVEALGGDRKKLADFALIPELAHNGSIMIDDVEDSGELRRGRPCTHRIFGTDIAINAGNFLYFLPLMILLKKKDLIPKERLLKVYEIYAEEMLTIHLGQGTDIIWHKGEGEPNEKRYMQLCAAKTGTLARLAARLAAVLVRPELEEKLGKIAEKIGIIFQIRDDILSASGEKFAAKKGFGDDITEGKRTLLVIHTLKKASEDDAKRLLQILNMHTKDEKLIKEALQIIKKYGSIEYAREVANNLAKEVWSELDETLADSQPKKLLQEFIKFLIERDI